MTFSWKMKQNNKMTVTMFSPDNFIQRSKPQKITTTTPQIVISQENTSLSSKYNVPPSPQHQGSSNGIDLWEFHSESYPRANKKNPPPLSKMISAPGNLQQFTYGGVKGEMNISEFQANSKTQTSDNSSYYSSPSQKRQRNTRGSSIKKNCPPPPLKTQVSSPSVVSLVSPISRLSISKKSKTSRPYKLTKKLGSTSDLMKMSATNSPQISIGQRDHKQFQPPPLLSRNSESSIPGLLNVRKNTDNVLPSVHDLVNGSPSNSPYSSCNESSDQEMREMENRTSRMSIQNLIGP